MKGKPGVQLQPLMTSRDQEGLVAVSCRSSARLSFAPYHQLHSADSPLKGKQTLDFALADPPAATSTRDPSANSAAAATSHAAHPAHPKLNEVATTEMKALNLDCILLECDVSGADKTHAVQCERLCPSPHCEGTATAASLKPTVVSGARAFAQPLAQAQTPIDNNIFSALQLGDLLDLKSPTPSDLNTLLSPARCRGIVAAVMEPNALDFFGEHLHLSPHLEN